MTQNCDDRPSGSWLEDPRFDLSRLTPGQRYTALIVIALAATLLAFGVPRGAGVRSQMGDFSTSHSASGSTGLSATTAASPPTVPSISSPAGATLLPGAEIASSGGSADGTSSALASNPADMTPPTAPEASTPAPSSGGGPPPDSTTTTTLPVPVTLPVGPPALPIVLPSAPVDTTLPVAPAATPVAPGDWESLFDLLLLIP